MFFDRCLSNNSEQSLELKQTELARRRQTVALYFEAMVKRNHEPNIYSFLNVFQR